jgi:hypothetical protein
MVSDMKATLPQLPLFNWQLEYAPHWEGRNDGCLNDILFRPGPEDVLIIDGIRAPFGVHLARAARKETLQ